MIVKIREGSFLALVDSDVITWQRRLGGWRRSSSVWMTSSRFLLTAWYSPVLPQSSSTLVSQPAEIRRHAMSSYLAHGIIAGDPVD